jgi:hypothetical protein
MSGWVRITLIAAGVWLSACSSSQNVSTLDSGPAPMQPEGPPSAGVPSAGSKLAWARTDGQLISGSPELTAQARQDIAVCEAASPPVLSANGIVGEPCMEERGYYARELTP